MDIFILSVNDLCEFSILTILSLISILLPIKSSYKPKCAHTNKKEAKK